MSIEEALKNFSQKLARASINSAILDTELLISFVLGKPKEFVITHGEKKLTPRQFKKLEILVKKRQAHVPLAYLTGKKEFFGLEFKVTPAVLIPRPETEMLVEEAINIGATNILEKTRTGQKIVDVGTGSGAIIISLARSIKKPYPDLIATEISAAALKIAKKNAKLNQAEDKINFLKGDLLKPVKTKVDLIVANLPYLSFKEYYNSPFYQEIKWEPKIALTDEKDGLESFRRLFKQAPKILKKGTIILEIGHDQANPIKSLAKEAYPKAEIKINKDLCGFDRLAIIKV